MNDRGMSDVCPGSALAARPQLAQREQSIIIIIVLLLLFVFIAVNVSVLVLRRKPVDHPHFRVWTFVPVLGIASCVLLLTQQEPIVWLFGAIALAVGGVLYAVARLFPRETSDVSG